MHKLTNTLQRSVLVLSGAIALAACGPTDAEVETAEQAVQVRPNACLGLPQDICEMTSSCHWDTGGQACVPNSGSYYWVLRGQEGSGYGIPGGTPLYEAEAGYICSLRHHRSRRAQTQCAASGEAQARLGLYLGHVGAGDVGTQRAGAYWRFLCWMLNPGDPIGEGDCVGGNESSSASNELLERYEAVQLPRAGSYWRFLCWMLNPGDPVGEGDCVGDDEE